MDPLRAGRVLLFEDGLRYLCGEDCRERFLAGERDHDASRRTKARTPVPPPPEEAREPAAAPPPPVQPMQESPGPGRPWVGLMASAAGLLLAIVPGPLVAAVLSGLASTGAAVVALRRTRQGLAEAGAVPWLVGPAGVAVAAAAGLAQRMEDPGAWVALAGAALASAAMLGRAWLDARARQPVDAALRELMASIPQQVRVPISDRADPVTLGLAMDQTARVRTGEEVVVLEGEVAAVDGVVQAGAAWALLHPEARTPVRRVPGDPLLAGARITEGGVRILASRVGDDRALVRPARFGGGQGRDDALVTRLADRASRWGALALLLLSLVGFALASQVSEQLTAVAAVLLAAPLWTALRGTRAPLLAAAAAAGTRGIVFQNARTLEDAGRVAVAALSTHGIVTEGDPEVVEVHTVDGSDVRPLIALAAAAEAAAPGQPIARAIATYAEARDITPQSVRRATFVAGRGVTALGPGGEPIAIGNRQLLLDEGVSIAVADAEAARAESRGHTALFMGVGGKVRAVFSLRDEIRPGARAAVQRIFDLRVEVVLISGDHRASVETLARTLDVANVKAELLPDERGAEVKKLSEAGGLVAAVGRPGEDDELLGAADVPVVVGAAGSPAGDRGIALASEDVRDAAAALWIARAARIEAWRAALLSLSAGAFVVLLGVLGVIGAGAAAVLAVAVDAAALPAGSRLLRRVTLRLPARG